MKMSKLFFNTLRETPADAEVISHQLLIRAGYIRKTTSGIYTYMPLMYRVLKKIENIIREEMDAKDAQELLLPILQPEELWQESGRWEVYGKELMRLKDRHGKMCALGPTHEEIITALARDEIKSYRQLPVNLYQIQDKFRDEIRPRFGLLRGKEFIMKDAYSFDADEEGLDVSYQKMTEAYINIFNRCGLETKMVRSDSGAIGGSVSHEFMVLTRTDSGENDVLFCDSCGYAANSNRAESKMLPAETDGKFTEAREVDTPNVKTIETLSQFLNIPPSVICKSLVYVADQRYVLALIRGDKTIEEIKLKNALNANELRIATEADVKELGEKFNLELETGFIGSKGLNVQIIGDNSIADLKNFVVGINKADVHLVGANWGKDIDLPKTLTDIRLAEAGEICPNCSGKLDITKGIEVGNIFKLGTKYSKKMKATFTDETGKENPFIMGCYGIGVSRTAAAAIERYHDENGIKWPMAIAPYHVIIVPVNINDTLQMETAEAFYKELTEKNIEVIIDDRSERAGVKFKDADLIGIPVRITVGKTITEGNVEIKIRSTGEMTIVPKDEAVNKVLELITTSI
ncbi:MAG: proline--tRNA ligase [bacterium]